MNFNKEIESYLWQKSYVNEIWFLYVLEKIFLSKFFKE